MRTAFVQTSRPGSQRALKGNHTTCDGGVERRLGAGEAAERLTVRLRRERAET